MSGEKYLLDTNTVVALLAGNQDVLFLLIAAKNFLQDILKTSEDIVRFKEHMNNFLKQRIQRDVIYV